MSPDDEAGACLRAFPEGCLLSSLGSGPALGSSVCSILLQDLFPLGIIALGGVWHADLVLVLGAWQPCQACTPARIGARPSAVALW